ncbi:hypothetical protein JCM10908_003052 [Rhodotorula pacifica]|uniref:uncharacterized protein n=1 Tax=Rhodotorula pacifica TaxID=1495444 RepID=UPI0031776A12
MNRIVSSPIIRSPSLLPRPQPRRPRTLTPPLPPSVLLLLRCLLVLLVLWAEILSFRVAASWQCGFDDSPSVKGRVWDGSIPPSQAQARRRDSSSKGVGKSLSSSSRGWTADDRWKLAAQSQNPAGTPFHVLVVADPQLLDMRSYPGRNPILKWLGVKMTDLYARKSWRAVSRLSRGKSGGKVDAVVWLGDLLDSGTEMVDRKEHLAYVHRFHRNFPLPRASTSLFSTLSRGNHRGSSHLVPPIPSILVPGNHDLGLHSPSSSLAAYARERFSEAFGPTWGEREWNGWSVVWVDAMALLEPEFREGEIGGEYSEMRQWLNDLGDGPITQPRILLTHIPLYRPEGTPCGRAREATRPIRQGNGRNYQNELDKETTQWLMDRVRPSLVYSGDDHDSCVYATEFSSPLDGRTPVTETTVKAFSMAMGIRHPGYHLLSLYAPLPPSEYLDATDLSEVPVSYTYTQTNCTLPDQLGTYLHLYIPLAACFFLFFFVPKLAAATRAYLQRRKHRRAASARANGLPSSSAGGMAGLKDGAGGGGGFSRGKNGSARGGHIRSLSQKLSALAGGGTGARRATTAEEDADIDDAESQFPALLGGVTHLDGSPYSGTGVTDSDSDQDEDDDNDALDRRGEVDRRGGAILPTSLLRGKAANGGSSEKGSNGRGHHVRRVSRVWLWEGSSSRPGSPPRSSSPFGGGGGGGGTASIRHGLQYRSASSSSFASRIVHLFQRLLDRLLANSLLTPLYRRFIRPLTRSIRSTWRKIAAPVAAVVGGNVGGPVGQALAEAVRDLCEVAWPAVTLWCLHVVWYLS